MQHDKHLVCPLCKKSFSNPGGFQTHYNACLTKPIISFEVDDDGKLYSKWLNKRNNAKKEGIECELTYEEFCLLVKAAGIVSSELGFSAEGKYVFARYNDSGNYTYNNCRVITQLENAQERKPTSKVREEFQYKVSKEELRARIIHGQQNSEKFQTYLDSRRKSSIKVIDTKNSQYGTYWITNGVENRKWKDSKGIVPDGFYKGRVVSKK